MSPDGEGVVTKIRRRTEIYVETERTLAICRGRGRRALCEACGREVDFVRAGEAAGLSGTGLRELCRRVESGELHFAEAEDGALFICLASLDAAD